ncbi:Ca2+-dependent phosphoinositide-specific phospholipase C [Novosphingobium sp. FKTRR1]|uniref:Ca2+-dependent phosphoinositide-specific phospholipase C n=1 Tax=Novosphingobium sp. FKTRR1 TaxID=2879118 RepID=UPI001CF02A89|nr:Ca2+-dependent phosphoinositide-specific phospholipase C [Novosphingobium sp. FKTRR1]
MWQTAARLLLGPALLAGTDCLAHSCNLSAADAPGAGTGCERAWIDHNLKLNDIVTVGTHNSYKQALPEAVMTLVRKVAPGSADEIDYRHRPLSEQLDAGARQLEIDVYHDPDGGRFLDPAGLRAAGIALDPARRAALAEPGFKVLHVPDIDVMSNCITLTACLGVVRRWSLAHPDHTPILLLFNAKTDASPYPGGVAGLPFDHSAFATLDRAVRSVFPPSALITPDDVQGAFPTLREAVLHGGWPNLGRARGKVMFALDEDPLKVAAYMGAQASLAGRVFFVNAEETSPVAAYLTLNDPLADAARIRKAVADGFIVRTRADAGTIEARRNDTARRDAALKSGAQFVSTDYLWPEPQLHDAYQVRLPDGAAALCNPVRAAGRCGEVPVEAVAATGNGYLSPEDTPDGVRILPPPPRPDSPLARADRAVFATTPRLAGTPRWKLASADVHSEAFEHFACALGARLTPQSAPALARLLDRASTAGVVDPVKSFYRTQRPYLRSSAPICQPRTAALAANGDYPSGHAAGGWMEALILAELAPDRASELLARGRAFGESRFICGAHSHSAVAAGWLAGAAATAALHGSAAFRADLDAARSELAALRKTAPTPAAATCRAESAALVQDRYFSATAVSKPRRQLHRQR